jgi:hypothetical protein
MLAQERDGGADEMEPLLKRSKKISPNRQVECRGASKGGVPSLNKFLIC